MFHKRVPLRNTGVFAKRNTRHDEIEQKASVFSSKSRQTFLENSQKPSGAYPFEHVREKIKSIECDGVYGPFKGKK